MNGGGRPDLGNHIIPNMITRERVDPVFENLPPIATRGLAAQDGRTMYGGIESNGRTHEFPNLENRAPVLFTTNNVINYKDDVFEHVVAEHMEAVSRLGDLYVGRNLEDPNAMDSLNTVLLRNNPLHIPYKGYSYMG